MSPTLGKVSAKYKKQKLSSEVLAEILRSDDEDDLVEFINNSFPKSGPNTGNNNKKRGRTNKDQDVMHEVDLSALKGNVSKYDLSSNGGSIIVGDKPRKGSRICITFGLFVSFFALGVAIAILGPSLLDLKDQVHSSFQAMSMVFTARSVGYLLGSVIAGWLLDKWNDYFVMAISCFIASVSLIIIPLTGSFLALVITIASKGLALGSLDTAGNVMLLNLYGKGSDVQMQGLHAMFGLGAFVSPLVVGPFLTNHHSGNDMYRHMYTNNSNVTYAANSTIAPTILTTNTSMQSLAENSKLSLKWPFWISAIFFIIPILVFIPAGLKNTNFNQHGLKTLDKIQKDERKAFRGFSLVLLFIFLLLYVGMEVAIGGLILSFVVNGGIFKSKSLAAYLTSTFWGSFCIGRFLGIPLAMYARPYVILVADMLGCLLGALLLVFLSSSTHAWLWVGTCILGASMASVFPSTMSWAESFMHITGKSASLLVVGAALGEMSIPLAIGTLMERNGPGVFLHSILVIVVLAMIVFTVVAVLGKRQQKEDIDKFGIHYRKAIEPKGNHSMFSKGDEIVQLLEDSSEIFSVEN